MVLKIDNGQNTQHCTQCHTSITNIGSMQDSKFTKLQIQDIILNLIWNVNLVKDGQKLTALLKKALPAIKGLVEKALQVKLRSSMAQTTKSGLKRWKPTYKLKNYGIMSMVP